LLLFGQSAARSKEPLALVGERQAQRGGKKGEGALIAGRPAKRGQKRSRDPMRESLAVCGPAIWLWLWRAKASPRPNPRS
jgi:hypothetical protein